MRLVVIDSEGYQHDLVDNIERFEERHTCQLGTETCCDCEVFDIPDRDSVADQIKRFLSQEKERVEELLARAAKIEVLKAIGRKNNE